MKRPIAFTLIVSQDLAEAIGNRIHQRFTEEEGFGICSSQTEPYWKDSMLQISIWEFFPTSPRAQAQWVALFDQVVCHNAVSTDADSLEIAHYSAVGDRNDPFVILYIPDEWVLKEENL